MSLCDWLLAFRSSGGCVICRVACFLAEFVRLCRRNEMFERYG